MTGARPESISLLPADSSVGLGRGVRKDVLQRDDWFSLGSGGFLYSVLFFLPTPPESCILKKKKKKKFTLPFLPEKRYLPRKVMKPGRCPPLWTRSKALLAWLALQNPPRRLLPPLKTAESEPAVRARQEVRGVLEDGLVLEHLCSSFPHHHG